MVFDAFLDSMVLYLLGLCIIQVLSTCLIYQLVYIIKLRKRGDNNGYIKLSSVC